jgi:hypothetical protein
MAELAGFPSGDPIAALYNKHKRSPQPESKQVSAVLEAVAEILRQEGIPPSPTAVFAAVMSSLERADTQVRGCGITPGVIRLCLVTWTGAGRVRTPPRPRVP